MRAWTCACGWKNEPERKACALCRTRKGGGRTALRRKADALARELCRSLADGRCASCGRPGSDWAHRLPRRHYSVRWSMDNCDFLCRACHQRFTDRPFLFAAWLSGKGVDMADLERRANEPWDRDYAEVIASLSERLAAERRTA